MSKLYAKTGDTKITQASKPLSSYGISITEHIPPCVQSHTCFNFINVLMETYQVHQIYWIVSNMATYNKGE